MDPIDFFHFFENCITFYIYKQIKQFSERFLEFIKNVFSIGPDNFEKKIGYDQS